VSTTRAAPLLVRGAHGHAEESFESFSERYVNFFQSAEDLFEVQRGLNNCFAHDLVPSPSVVEAAVRAARRVNDYATAIRIFEGVKEKVENRQQYEMYLQELKPLRDELGMFASFLRVCLMLIRCCRPEPQGRTLPLIVIKTCRRLIRVCWSPLIYFET
jgi:cytochrome c oxidase subunit 5a